MTSAFRWIQASLLLLSLTPSSFAIHRIDPASACTTAHLKKKILQEFSELPPLRLERPNIPTRDRAVIRSLGRLNLIEPETVRTSEAHFRAMHLLSREELGLLFHLNPTEMRQFRITERSLDVNGTVVDILAQGELVFFWIGSQQYRAVGNSRSSEAIRLASAPTSRPIELRLREVRLFSPAPGYDILELSNAPVSGSGGRLTGISRVYNPLDHSPLVQNLVSVWDIASGALLQQFSAQVASGTAISSQLSADGDYLLTRTGGDRIMQLSRTMTPAPIYASRPIESGPFFIQSQFSTDGTRAMIIEQSGTFHFWDLQPTLGNHQRFEWGAARISAVSLNRDGTLAAIADSAGLHLLRTTDGARMTLPTLHSTQGILRDVEISADGLWITSAMHNNIHVFNAHSGAISTYTVPGIVSRYRLDPQRPALWVLDSLRIFTQIDLLTGNVLSRHQMPDTRKQSFDISSDGRWILLVLEAEGAGVWDVRTQLPIAEVPAPPGVTVEQAFFSPDSRFVVAQLSNGEVSLLEFFERNFADVDLLQY